MRCCWKISRIEHRVRAPWHPRAVGIRVVFFCILSCDVHPGSSSRDRDASSCCFFFFFFSFFISPSRILALVRVFSPPPFFGDGKWPRVAKSAESVFFFLLFFPLLPQIFTSSAKGTLAFQPSRETPMMHHQQQLHSEREERLPGGKKSMGKAFPEGAAYLQPGSLL